MCLIDKQIISIDDNILLYHPTMTCNCENHSKQFTCSGDDCNVCVLSEENYIENPAATEERYCISCAMKKGGFTQQEIWQLMLANQKDNFECDDKR